MWRALRPHLAPLNVGLALVVVVQAAAAFGYAVLGAAWSIWAGLAASLVIALAMMYAARRRETASLDRLASVCRTLADDCDSLSNALADMGRGNLETRVTLQSQPIAAPAADGHAALQEISGTIHKLHRVAQEFNELTAEPLQRLCYVGADSYLEGRICGDAMGRALGGHGQVAVTLAYSVLAPMVARSMGFESAVRERYPGIRVVTVVETSLEPERAYVAGRQLIERYPDLRGIYVTDGITLPGIGRAVLAAGAAGQVCVIGHDLGDETAHYLGAGAIHTTLLQDLFAQGHDSVIHVFNHLAAGWRPAEPRMLTHLQMVTQDNYQQFWQAGRGVVEGAAAAGGLAQPSGRAQQPLRIAVQNRAISDVDRQLQLGALAAAAKLRHHGARVEVISGGTLTVQPIVENVLADGYDALTVLAANKLDVPSLSKAAESGVVVATYNAEPLSLRAWVASLADRARELHTAGGDLGAGPPPADLASLPLAGTSATARPDPSSALLRQAVQFMHDNLENEISVVDVAHHVALDPSYFCRLFTAQTGRNPSDYLIDLRIELAKEYLIDSDRSVMDVCVALGYSPSYFSRLFKSRVGCTPGQYAQRATRPRRS